MAEQFGLGQIGQIAIVTRNTAAMTEFYRDKLGMKFLFTAGNMAFLMCGDVRIMLSPPEKPEHDHPASILYFKVPNIQVAHQALVARGVKFEDQPHLIAKLPDHDLWMCFFRDPENNIFGLMCEVRS
ncbi:MAG TPA: VOC family protein [Terriglobales bacterium]|jgi:methylmalonyl-CoA/ethylmalonyl-CoA epimerase|nr:VOC family protein [Terriglobales bacterium]